MDKFSAEKLLRLNFIDGSTLTPESFNKQYNHESAPIYFKKNALLKLWLVCNMDTTFTRIHNLQFDKIKEEVLAMEFSVNLFNVIPMIFLEVLLNQSGDVGGSVIANLADLFFFIRLRRLKLNLITIPDNDSTHDDDNIVCDLLQTIYQRDYSDHPRFRVSLVSSIKHAMITYMDKNTSTRYICNSGEGLNPYHPKVLVFPPKSQPDSQKESKPTSKKAYFYQCVLPLPNGCSIKDEEIYRRLSVTQTYTSLNIPVIGDVVSRFIKDQSFFSIGCIRFFIQNDLLYIIPQAAGTCSYYSIMIYLIRTLHSLGWSEQKIQTYFTSLFDHVLDCITMSKFRSNMDMSIAHAFVHLLRKEKSSKLQAFQSKFLEYKLDYLADRCNRTKREFTPWVPKVSSSPCEFPQIPDKTILSLEWDDTLTLTLNLWLRSNFVLGYANSIYGKIFLQHYMNKVRDLWRIYDEIPKEQFLNVVGYLDIMLPVQHYHRMRQDNEMTNLEGRQLSMTFYFKFKQFIRKILHKSLHEKWEKFLKFPLAGDDIWKEYAVEFAPYFNPILKVDDHYLIRKIAIMENTLSPEFFPAMYTPSLERKAQNQNFHKYFFYETIPTTIPILEFPIIGSAADIPDTSINCSHETWQIDSLQSDILDHAIMVRNYLSNGLVFHRFSTAVIHRLLLVCSHYRVTLQIQNVLMDNDTVELWRSSDSRRFYYYCWAILMCKDTQYGDEYVLNLMGDIPDKHYGQSYILLHLHDHKKYLRKFCRADSVYYEPLKLHLLYDSNGVFQPYIPQLRNALNPSYTSWIFRDPESKNEFTCIDYKGPPKIMAMIEVLQEMATVVVYEEGQTQVIDVSAHESEQVKKNSFVTRHRWIHHRNDKYWQLENSDWRIYDSYDQEMEQEWITYGQITGCVMLLKKEVINAEKVVTYQYGLLLATNPGVINPGTKYWRYHIENYPGKKIFTILDTIITKTIDTEQRDMITPVIKDTDTFLHLYILLVYYVSPLTDRLYPRMKSFYYRYANANSFNPFYYYLLDESIVATEDYDKEWIKYWETQKLTIQTNVDVYKFWYSQGGLVPNKYQEEEIHSLVHKQSTCMRQYIMGVGKSSVIIPHIVLHYLQKALKQENSYNIVLIQPEHLVNVAFMQLAKISLIDTVHVLKEVPTRLVDGNIYIYVFSDAYIKQRWKLLMETKKLQINVLIIDEFDSVCMPCKSDFNVCSNLVKGIASDDHKHPDFIQWLQYKSPDVFIQQLPLREVSISEFTKTLNNPSLSSDNINKLHQIYNSCIKWNFNVDYGFRLTGANASPFVVPFITTNIPDPVSEFQSNEVRLIATCLALRQQRKLLPKQQQEFDQHIAFLVQIGMLSKSSNDSNTLSRFVTYCLFPKLTYSQSTENVNMTDILLPRPNRIVYGFSGTVAIPTYKDLQINCITYDPTFPKISYMLETKLSKHTAPHFTDKEYQHYLKKKYPKKYKHFPTHEIDSTWEATTNVQLPDQRVIPIHDGDTIWSSLASFDVIIDSCGFFKNRNHMTLVQQMHLHLKRPIVYINRQHIPKVYPGNYNYPYSNLTTNFSKPQDYHDFVFYFDHSHIVGTDIKHPNKLRILVFTNVTSKEYVVVQAMYRIRGVHDPLHQHYIKFAIDLEQIKDNNKILDVANVDDFSLRKIARLWKFNQSKEVGVNKSYLKYQYKFALFKRDRQDWNQQHFNQYIESQKDIESDKSKKPVNLQATVQNSVTVNVNVNLSQMMTQNESTLDRSGIKMKVIANTGELTNIGTVEVVKGIFISDFCYKYIYSSQQNNRLVLFLVKSPTWDQQVIISGEELQYNISSFNAASHRISNIYGHEICPTFKSCVDWILPSLTHAPTISFYSFLETMHSRDVIPEVFFPLQKLFETKIQLFNPILTWSNDRRLRSTVVDKESLHQFQHKLEETHNLIPTIRKILKSL